MIETNAAIVQFVTDNAIGLGAAIMFLRGLAKVTPWKWDSAIVELLAAMVTIVRKPTSKP